MTHSPPRGYGLVNTFDLPGDEQDVDTKLRLSTKSDHRSRSLDRAISIDSPKTPKISPRQRKGTNVLDHEYHVVPSSDPELKTLPPIQTSRNQDQHSIAMLPNHNGYFRAAQETSQESPSCCGYVYALLFTFMVLIAILLLISSSPNVPIIQLDSLSVVKINATGPSDSKIEIKMMWDFQLTVKNPEDKWRGMFHSVNCTVYKQLEPRVYYEEDSRNLYEIANVSRKEGFSLDPGAGKELEFELEMEETKDLEGASFVLWVTTYVSFDRSGFQWYSGNVNYNSGSLRIDQDTGTLANGVPVRCKFTLPLI